MPDQQRIAEIEAEYSEAKAYGAKGYMIPVSHVEYLLSQLAVKDAEIERLKAEANADYSEIADTMAGLMGEIERLREAQRCPIFEGKRLDNGETVWGGSFVQFLDDGVRTAYIPKYGEKCSCEHDDADNILAFEHGTFYRVGLDSVRIRTLPAAPEKGE